MMVWKVLESPAQVYHGAWWTNIIFSFGKGGVSPPSTQQHHLPTLTCHRAKRSLYDLYQWYWKIYFFFLTLPSISSEHFTTMTEGFWVSTMLDVLGFSFFQSLTLSAWLIFLQLWRILGNCVAESKKNSLQKRNLYASCLSNSLLL